MIKIKNTENINIRIDKFLSNNKKINLSRSQIQKIIKLGLVSVNNKIINTNYKLKNNDTIIIKKEKRKTKEKNTIKLNIIDETEDFLIINKNQGLITHKSKHIKEKTLVDYLLEKYPKLIKVGNDKNRPGIVHRLDKDVGGLMIIAKTNLFFNYIKQEFKNRKIIKKYIALVYGKIEPENNIINFPISRSSLGIKMAAHPFNNKINKSKEAITEFKVLKRYINYSLLEVKIKTGRTHQIRVHLFAYGHPIVGDVLYNTNKTKKLNKKINLDNIFLMSNFLSFYDLNKTKKTYKIKLSEKLNNFLKTIK